MYQIAQQLVDFMRAELTKRPMANAEYRKALYEAIVALDKVMRFW